MGKRKTAKSILMERKKDIYGVYTRLVLKVSQEDVLGILTKMDQYLFGKCNLMYFLILDNFVYRIQSLLLSAI